MSSPLLLNIGEPFMQQALHYQSAVLASTHKGTHHQPITQVLGELTDMVGNFRDKTVGCVAPSVSSPLARHSCQSSFMSLASQAPQNQLLV